MVSPYAEVLCQDGKVPENENQDQKVKINV